MIARLHALASDLRAHPSEALTLAAATACLWLVFHMADRVIFGLFVSGVL